MSAIVLYMTDYRKYDKSVAERVANQLTGVSECVMAWAQASAVSYQKRTKCTDDQAVKVGLRTAMGKPIHIGDAT